MKKALAERWAKALESGRYKKTTGRLGDSEGFCCLGVLCELAKKSGVIEHYAKTNGGLPTPVAEWSGLGYTGEFTDRGYRKIKSKGKKIVRNTLAELNDAEDGAASFKQIARIIRKNYKDL